MNEAADLFNWGLNVREGIDPGERDWVIVGGEKRKGQREALFRRCKHFGSGSRGKYGHT